MGLITKEYIVTQMYLNLSLNLLYISVHTFNSSIELFQAEIITATL